MTQLKYAISSNFINDKELVDNFLAWYELASRKQKSIVKYIIWMAAKKSRVFPSQARIAAFANCSREWVSRVLKIVAELGFICKIRRPYHSNEYFVPNWLAALDLNDVKIFRRSPPIVNIREQLSTANCLGKGHNGGHKEGHTSSKYSPINTEREENVFVRFSYSSNGDLGTFGTEKDKQKILSPFVKNKSDIKKLCKFSQSSILRALKDYEDYAKIGNVVNLPAFLTTHCQVYQRCENTGITPTKSWQMYHDEKRQQGKRL